MPKGLLTTPRILFFCIVAAVLVVIYQVYIRPARSVLPRSQRSYRHIAIYNGLTHHYEMFGYIIDYCKQNGIKLDIYTNQLLQYGWIDFYKKYYGDSITILNKGLYTPSNNYDATIFPTSNDRFPDWWLSQTKSICICHNPIYVRKNAFQNILTRPMTKVPNLPHCLSVYRCIRADEKLKISKPQIVCVGSNLPKDVPSLAKLIPNFKDYVFIFIRRQIDTAKFRDYPNIKCFPQASAEKMITILRESDYALVKRIAGEEGFTDNVMSGIIPTALGCLCTLLMPEEQNEHYKFKSTQPYTEVIKIAPPNYAAVDAELNELINRRNKVLDEVIFNKE